MFCVAALLTAAAVGNAGQNSHTSFYFNVNVSSGIIKTLRIIPLMKLNGTLIQAAAKASPLPKGLFKKKRKNRGATAQLLKKPITSIDTVPAKDARINRQNVERVFFFNPAKIAVNGSK